MERNLMLGIALLMAVVGIAVAPADATPAVSTDELSRLVEGYKDRTAIDIIIKDQGSSHIDLYIDAYMLDERGMPLDLEGAIMEVSVVTYGDGVLKQMVFMIYAQGNGSKLADVYPTGSIFRYTCDIVKQKMVLPIKNNTTGVIELREVDVPVLQLDACIRYFSSEDSKYLVRSYGDPVSVLAVMAVEKKDGDFKTGFAVKQYYY